MFCDACNDHFINNSIIHIPQMTCTNTNVQMNRVKQDGWTALQAAACEGHKDIAQALIYAGANPNQQHKVSPNDFYVCMT